MGTLGHGGDQPRCTGDPLLAPAAHPGEAERHARAGHGASEVKSPRQFWRETTASWALSQQITIPDSVPARPPQPGGLRVAFLIYGGNPLCGGQGVYTRPLTRVLVALGHSVELFAGQPWPELDEGVGFPPVPSLDLYRDP